MKKFVGWCLIVGPIAFVLGFVHAADPLAMARTLVAFGLCAVFYAVVGFGIYLVLEK